MSKLQPNFSWQKYEGEEQDQKEQFQHQLQQQHVVVANSVNATIDDESFFARERQTSFTWLDNRPIWKKTISGTIVGTAVTPYAHGISGIHTVVALTGAAQRQKPLSNIAVPLPYLDPTNLANSVGLDMDTDFIYLDAPNNAKDAFLFSVTIYYTKI